MLLGRGVVVVDVMKDSLWEQPFICGEAISHTATLRRSNTARVVKPMPQSRNIASFHRIGQALPSPAHSYWYVRDKWCPE